MKYKRKRQGKTNYKKRLGLLKSNNPRLVVRKSLKNISAQIIEYHKEGDKVILSADTKEIKNKFNFPAKRNIPSAYIVGLLIASKAKEKKIKEAVLDTGLQNIIKGSLIYSVLKGAVDGGLNIPHSEKAFPKEERINGKHTKYSETEKKKIEEIKSKLSKGEK